MAVALRLMKFGKKGLPHYRVVALDKRQKRDGAYLERVGTYNPMVEPAVLEVNQERFDYWVKCGAQISEGLARLLKNRKPTAEVKKTPVDAKPAKAPAKKATKKAAPKKEAVEKSA